MYNICRINKKTQTVKNLRGHYFTKFIKCLEMQQLTKFSDFSRESGDFLHGHQKVAFVSYSLLYL